VALVVVPDDGDGQDGEIHEGEEGAGSRAQHDDDRAAKTAAATAAARPTRRQKSPNFFTHPIQLKSPPTTN
jgi:hypothetical protein